MSSIPVANDTTLVDICMIGCEQEAKDAPATQLLSHLHNSPPHIEPSQELFVEPRCSSANPPRSLSGGSNESTDVEVSASNTTCMAATIDSDDRPTFEHQSPARSLLQSANGLRLRRNSVESQPAAPLHRAREVRIQQGISVRSMSRRLGIDAKSYKHLEEPTTDLTLRELTAIQQALDVPLSELLFDRNSLSRPVEERAKLVRAMKTAVALRECKSSQRVERMATMLCEQLVDLMPELREVSGWPKFGARRGENALGKALCQPIDTSQLRISE